MFELQSEIQYQLLIMRKRHDPNLTVILAVFKFVVIMVDEKGRTNSMSRNIAVSPKAVKYERTYKARNAGFDFSPSIEAHLLIFSRASWLLVHT